MEGKMARSNIVRRNPFRSCRRRRLDPTNKNARAWEGLPADILMVIIMKLGLFDFLAFNGVCKSWRSEAVSNRSTFFDRKEPLLMTLSNKVCTVTNILDKGRRYKIDLGTSSGGGHCVGVSCGYLIIRQRKASELLYLVNPITRHELYFPPLPENTPFEHARFRAILVYLSWPSKPVVIILCRGHNRNHYVLFSGPGDSEWVFLPIPDGGWNIVDLAFFKGKIYMLNCDGRLGEMNLKDGLSNMKLLDVKRMPSSIRELVSSGEGLYMVSHPSGRLMVKVCEFDFEKMEWVVRAEDMGEKSLFLNNAKSSAVVNTTNWFGDWRTEYNGVYILPHGRNTVWYFVHEFYRTNGTNVLTNS